jgi:hypothetical protein
MELIEVKIPHKCDFCEKDKKELEIDTMNYFSTEILMWRKRFAQENLSSKDHVNWFLSIPSDNFMRCSPEEHLKMILREEDED